MATAFHDRVLPPSETSAGIANHAGVADEPEELEATGSLDLYGNEVIEAVTTYQLDDAGSLYEVHSPQTELPELGSPKG
jgi:hypothetical protein